MARIISVQFQLSTLPSGMRLQKQKRGQQNRRNWHERLIVVGNFSRTWKAIVFTLYLDGGRIHSAIIPKLSNFINYPLSQERRLFPHNPIQQRRNTCWEGRSQRERRRMNGGIRLKCTRVKNIRSTQRPN